jgi:acyl carrier protein
MILREETNPRLPPEVARQHVIDAWKAALPLGDLDSGFFDQGGTSLTAVLLVAQLEKTLDIEVPFAILATCDGVEGLVTWVYARLSQM